MRGKKTGGRTQYPLHEMGTTDICVLAALYAKKGVQLKYGCTDFDMVSILVISDHRAVSAMSLMRLSGYSKGRIYQRLKTSIKRGIVKQVSTRPNQYRLTDRGLWAYSMYKTQYQQQLDALHKMIRECEPQNE
jgi:hypothetical protein